MKKIFISILVLISVQSFGQTRLYAIRTNADATKDSFFIPRIGPGVYNSAGNYVCPQVDSITSVFGLEFPLSFGAFIKCADGVYRNVTTYTEGGSYTPTLFNTTNVAASTAYLCNWM